MIARSSVISVSLLLLVGCASSPGGSQDSGWHKAGATSQEFYRTRAECTAMAGPANHQIMTPQQTGYGSLSSGFQQGWNAMSAANAAQTNQRVFEDCMRGGGWALITANEARRRDQAHKSAQGQQAEQESEFWSQLEQRVPNFREINEESSFHDWLAQRDKVTGQQRQSLLEAAQSRLDYEAVAEIFRQYLATK
ncbi:hypothetical protein J4377_13415 [Halomonas sp. XH26]|uniref:hypothetical protein n=1 Tax=Halomonas sp. XH26 TaxID=2557993 RepID=UPI0020A1BB50|nr:hypothetical protein [Halomonas sp. XH26]UTA78951.1 hypothetical protein J4377_13415 [Halomonas sp. XH26]